MSEDKHIDISVVLPTRGRRLALERSVNGLIARAVKPKNIEVLFGFDDDDSVGVDAFRELVQPYLDKNLVSYKAISFAPMGYGRLHDYVNALAASARGDWIFFWNDDAVMETTGWDRVIASHTGTFQLLSVHTHRDHPYSIFPIVPKEWQQALGHLSQHQMNDAWISQIAYMLDIYKRIEVYVEHDRADLTGNNRDSTYENRIMYEGNPSNPHDFHNPEVTRRRLIETEQLATWMKSRGLDTEWWERVKRGQQDPWEKLRANDVNRQMVQFKIQNKAV